MIEIGSHCWDTCYGDTAIEDMEITELIEVSQTL